MTFVRVIAASVCALAVFGLGTWLASHLFPRPSRGFMLFWPRAWIALRAFIAATLLIATFQFGAWLTSPAFPVGRKFVAVSLNGKPIMSASRSAKLPTLEVRPQPAGLSLRAGGTAHCNWWGGDIKLLPLNIVVWDKVWQTAAGCDAWELERKFIDALRGATRWRTQDGFLIFENRTDVLRFLLLAPV